MEDKNTRKYLNERKNDLDFFKGKLSKFEIKILANCLSFNKNLRSLSIHGCQIEDSDLEYLLSFLTQDKNQTLQSLDLMYNDISELGCRHLRDFLYRNEKLQRLYIGMNNKITPLGIQFISYGLVGNTNLKLLSLQGLGLDDSESEVIKNFILHSKGLEILELQNNKFTQLSINEWSEGLKFNKNLTEINLTGNKIKDEGAILIAKVIMDNHHILSKIHLRANELTKKSYPYLYSAFEMNNKLKLLDLSANSDLNDNFYEKILALTIKRRNEF